MWQHREQLRWVMLAVVAGVVAMALSGCSMGGARHAADGSAPRSSWLALSRSTAGLRGDGDDDDEPGKFVPSYGQADNGDVDGDVKSDKEEVRKGYLDDDDEAVTRWGHAASVRAQRMLTRMVNEVRQAATNDDGAAGCALVTRQMASVATKIFAGPSAEPYLQGATSCTAVMSRLFHRAYKRLIDATVITGLRVKGAEALVLLGAPNAPASYVAAVLEDGVAKMTSLIILPFP